MIKKNLILFFSNITSTPIYNFEPMSDAAKATEETQEQQQEEQQIPPPKDDSTNDI